MLSALDEALRSRLESAGVLASLTGGLFAGRLPRADADGERRRFPYGVYAAVSHAPRLWTNSHEYLEHELQWTVYDRTKAGVENLLAGLRGALDFAPLALPAEAGELLEVRRTGERVRREADEVWQGVATYRARSRRARTA